MERFSRDSANKGLCVSASHHGIGATESLWQLRAIFEPTPPPSLRGLCSQFLSRPCAVSEPIVAVSEAVAQSLSRNPPGRGARKRGRQRRGRRGRETKSITNVCQAVGSLMHCITMSSLQNCGTMASCKHFARSCLGLLWRMRRWLVAARC